MASRPGDNGRAHPSSMDSGFMDGLVYSQLAVAASWTGLEQLDAKLAAAEAVLQGGEGFDKDLLERLAAGDASAAGVDASGSQAGRESAKALLVAAGVLHPGDVRAAPDGFHPMPPTGPPPLPMGSTLNALLGSFPEEAPPPPEEAPPPPDAPAPDAAPSGAASAAANLAASAASAATAAMKAAAASAAAAKTSAGSGAAGASGPSRVARQQVQVGKALSFLPEPSARAAPAGADAAPAERPRSRSRGRDRRRRRGWSRSASPAKPRSSIFTSTAAEGAQASAAPAAGPGRAAPAAAPAAPMGDVPDWLQDLAPSRPTMGKVTYTMSDQFTKCLIGRGGSTIRGIINRTGADIQVRSQPESDGVVSIVGNVGAAEAMMREVMASRGCFVPIHPGAAHEGAPGLAPAAPEGETPLTIPSELVGLFIGNEGSGIKEIKAGVGGGVSIKVLAPLLEGGLQEVQVVGEQWQRAKEIARGRVEECKKTTPGRWNMPGWNATLIAGGAALKGKSAGKGKNQQPMQAGYKGGTML